MLKRLAQMAFKSPRALVPWLEMLRGSSVLKNQQDALLGVPSPCKPQALPRGRHACFSSPIPTLGKWYRSQLSTPSSVPLPFRLHQPHCRGKVEVRHFLKVISSSECRTTWLERGQVSQVEIFQMGVPTVFLE